MRNSALIITTSLWLLFAATPQPLRHVHIYNIAPSRNTTTGVLTLPSTPKPLNSLRLYVNGIRQTPTEDFSVSGNIVTPVVENVALYADSTTIITADLNQ